MNISAVIVNYYTSSLLPPLIADLTKSRHISQIIIVDNCLELADASALPKSDNLKVIVNGANLGFGCAVNQAMPFVSGEYVLIVNPDIRIPATCIDELAYACAHFKCNLAGPRFYWDDNRIFRLPPATGTSMWLQFGDLCSGRYDIDAELVSFYWIIRHERYWNASEPFYEPFLSGACLLINHRWIKQNNGKVFDERFFMYYEDTDLCIRAVRSGIRPLCVPTAEAIHYYDQSPHSQKPSFMETSKQLFMSKHYGDANSDAVTQTIRGASDMTSVIDGGDIAEPPVIETAPSVFNGQTYFEMAYTPLFIPFVQAHVIENNFRIPNDIWRRLPPGGYFGRIRNQISGIQKVIKWKKL